MRTFSSSDKLIGINLPGEGVYRNSLIQSQSRLGSSGSKQNAPNPCSRRFCYDSFCSRARNRPGLPLLPARSGLGLSGPVSFHQLLAMRSHGLRDFFVLRHQPALCICNAAATASALSSGMVGTLPDGQISSRPCRDLPTLSSPLSKNISVFQKCKSGYMICHPVPLRGALAIVTNVGTGCGGRGSARAHSDRGAGFIDP
jgi:hypothetical protein